MHSICVSIIGQVLLNRRIFLTLPQVLQYKKGNEPKRIFDIFKFLFKNYPSELTQCLCKILQGTDKKHKLGALRLLENIVVSFCSIFLAVKPLKGNKEALFLDMKQLVNLLVALLGVVENDRYYIRPDIHLCQYPTSDITPTYNLDYARSVRIPIGSAVYMLGDATSAGREAGVTQRIQRNHRRVKFVWDERLRTCGTLVVRTSPTNMY